jgi:cytoskeletal protein CcmA (bactofilin family)
MWLRRRQSTANGSTVFIGDGCTIEGDCQFKGVAIVAGRITGDRISAEHLIVSPTGSVTGVVHATVVTVSGTIEGAIVAGERVELLATARVTGDIQTPAITMDCGAVLDGRCRTVRGPAAESPGALVPQTS